MKKPPLRKTLNRPAFKEAARITDARMKIIQKNRAKIRDARDKLVEITRNNGDVRKKLSQKQDLISSKPPYKASSFKYSRLGGDVGGRIGGKLAADGGGLKTRNAGYKSSLSTASLRRNEVLEIPRGYVDYDNMEKMEEGKVVIFIDEMKNVGVFLKQRLFRWLQIKLMQKKFPRDFTNFQLNLISFPNLLTCNIFFEDFSSYLLSRTLRRVKQMANFPNLLPCFL